MAIPSTNLHVDYPDLNRHWDPHSEKYAGGDGLLTAMQNGWEIDGPVLAEEYWCAGTRLVMIYHFTLVRGDETMKMPVLSNPYIQRLLQVWRLNVIPFEGLDQENGREEERVQERRNAREQ